MKRFKQRIQVIRLRLLTWHSITGHVWPNKDLVQFELKCVQIVVSSLENGVHSDQWAYVCAI